MANLLLVLAMLPFAAAICPPHEAGHNVCVEDEVQGLSLIQTGMSLAPGVDTKEKSSARTAHGKKSALCDDTTACRNNVFFAKLAEAGDRYDDMVESVPLPF